MFYGMIILCTVGVSDVNKNDCMVYASPTVYEYRATCYEAIKSFLSNEDFIANALALNATVRNIKCVDLSEKDVLGMEI